MLFLVLGPTLIGGRCYDKPGKKDCGSDCIPREQPCNGTCRHDQCQTKNKTCVELLDINRFSSMRHIQLIQLTFTQVRTATGKTVTESALSRVTSVTRSAGRSSARTRRAPVWTRRWTGQRRRRSWASTRSRAARACVWGRPSCAATPAATAASSAGAQTPASVSQSGKNLKQYVSGYFGLSDFRSKNVLKTGQMLRRSCGCVCIPYASRCEGRCGRGQCLEAGQCVSELERDDQGRRLRRACNEECSAWTAQCTHEWS